MKKATHSLIGLAILIVLLWSAGAAESEPSESAFPADWKIGRSRIALKAAREFESGMSSQTLFVTGICCSEEAMFGYGFFKSLDDEFGSTVKRPDLATQWQNGRATGLFPLGGGYYMLETNWVDYGSGSHGNNNYYVVTFDPPAIITGINVGGTHTFKAEMKWWPKDRLLVLDGACCDPLDAYIAWLPEGGSPKTVWLRDAVEKIAKEKQINDFDQWGEDPDRLDGSYRFISYGLVADGFKVCNMNEVETCKPRTDCGGCSDCGDPCCQDCEYMPLADSCEEAADGERIKTVTLPWNKLFGPDFQFAGGKPLGKWRQETVSPNGEWAIKTDARNNFAMSPQYKIYRTGETAPIDDEVEMFDNISGFAPEGLWRVTQPYDPQYLKTGLYWAKYDDLKRKSAKKLPIRNVRYAQQIGQDKLLITTENSLIMLDPAGGKAIEFLHRNKRKTITRHRLFEEIADAAPELNRSCLISRLNRDWNRKVPARLLYANTGAPEKQKYFNLTHFVTQELWYWTNSQTAWASKILAPCGAERVEAIDEEDYPAPDPRPRLLDMRAQWWTLWTRYDNPSQEKWTAAWRIGPGDYIIFEQLFAFGSGESGRLVRVKLKNDPFGNEPSQWLNE